MTMTNKSEKVNYISFGHGLDEMEGLRWLIICTSLGVRLYDLRCAVGPRIHASITKYSSVLLAEIFLDSQKIAMVTDSLSRRLIVQRLSDEIVLETRHYDSDILGVKLSRTRIVVLFEDIIHVYNASNKEQRLELDAKINPQYPACALTFQHAARDSTLLAYPSKTSEGEVGMHDIKGFSKLSAIPAHHSEIVALSFNGNGTRLATASKKGTVIRVFDVSTRDKLHELQRGLMRNVAIQSLAFKPDSTMLACSSDKETVHIFRLDDDDDEHGMVDYIRSALGALVPQQMSKVFGRNRAYAKVTLPTPGENTIAAWSNYYGSLLVATKDGVLRMFDANITRPGELRARPEIPLLKDAGDRACPGESE